MAIREARGASCRVPPLPFRPFRPDWNVPTTLHLAPSRFPPHHTTPFRSHTVQRWRRSTSVRPSGAASVHSSLHQSSVRETGMNDGTTVHGRFLSQCPPLFARHLCTCEHGARFVHARHVHAAICTVLFWAIRSGPAGSRFVFTSAAEEIVVACRVLS